MILQAKNVGSEFDIDANFYEYSKSELSKSEINRVCQLNFSVLATKFKSSFCRYVVEPSAGSTFVFFVSADSPPGGRFDGER